MSPQHRIFLLGFRKNLILIPGVIPFGILYASIAVNAGFPWWLVILFSIIVFAGTSQLVFIDLLSHLLTPLEAILGSNIVNARHLIYSAAVSKEFGSYSKKWRLLLGYLLTDQLFAFCESQKKLIHTIEHDLRSWIYFGAGFCTWFVWILSTGLGVMFGHFIPKSWNLSFSIPLIFMPLIFGMVKNKSDYLTCVLSVGLILLLYKLPFGLGLIISILTASLIGYLFYLRTEKRSDKSNSKTMDKTT